MTSVRNCAKCGKIFTYLVGTPLCPVCRQEDEKDFQKVKQYLYDHSGASMTEVSNALNISLKKIKRFLREGRLQTSGNTAFTLECERCGGPIDSGRYCDDCENEMSKQFRSVGLPKETSNTSTTAISEKKTGSVMRSRTVRKGFGR